MSFQAMAWATQQKCGSPSSKLILLALANYADDAGKAFPSIKTLSNDCEMSESSVKNHLKNLCAIGLISSEERKAKNGRQTSNIYTLSILGEGSKSDGGEGSKSDGSYIEPITKNLSHKNYNKKFDEFWNSYPKRNGQNPKKPAKDKFVKVAKSGVDVDKIIHAAKEYERWIVSHKHDRTFVKQALTWLNQECWNDALVFDKNELKVNFGTRKRFTGGV